MEYRQPGEYGRAHDYTNDYHTLGAVGPQMMVEGYIPEDEMAPPVEDYVNGMNLLSVYCFLGSPFIEKIVGFILWEVCTWVGNFGLQIEM